MTSWTTARTWTAGEIPTATIMNTHIRDNSNHLHERRAIITTDSDSSDRSTASTSYGDIATGFEITKSITSGNVVMVTVSGLVRGSGGNSDIRIVVSDGTDVHPIITIRDISTTTDLPFSGTAIITGLSGSITFTPQFSALGTFTCVIKGGTYPTQLAVQEMYTS